MAADAREALDFAKGMSERGVQNVEILDESGVVLDLAELERIVQEGEQSAGDEGARRCDRTLP